MAVAQDERVMLIRRKNVAFAALSEATIACYKRGKRGPLPTGWTVRLARLEAEYAQALRALDGKSLSQRID